MTQRPDDGASRAPDPRAPWTPFRVWWAPPSPLDPADLRALVAEGHTSPVIARLRGCRIVHVAETALRHGIRLNPGGWGAGPKRTPEEEALRRIRSWG